jgi:hypothetical protein
MIAKLLANQKGNIGLFVLGMLGIMMIMFVFVMNLGSILAKKEESNTTSTQASMAASSKLYEIVRNQIYNYENPEPDPDQPNYAEELLRYLYFKEYQSDPDLQGRINIIKDLPQYQDWSYNELKLEALDQYLVEGFNSTALIVAKLNELLHGRVDHDVIRMAIDAIEKNNGEIEEAILEIKKERIYIYASNEFESVSYDGLMDNYKQKIYQESAGPKIDFINSIWTGGSTVNLEYYDSLYDW